MFDKTDPYIGRVCSSSNGSIAFVLAKTDVPGKGIRWFGLALSGGIWKSRQPKIVDNDIFEFIKSSKTKKEDINPLLLGLCGYMTNLEDKNKSLVDTLSKLLKEKVKMEEDIVNLSNAAKQVSKEIPKEIKIVPEIVPAIMDKQDINIQIDKAIDNEVKSYIAAIRKIASTPGDDRSIITQAVAKIQERNKDRKEKRRKELK